MAIFRAMLFLNSWRSALRILGQADHIGEDAVGARHALRKLPVKRIGVVYVNPFAVLAIKQSTFLRSLAFIVRFQQGFVLRVPGLYPFRASLFHPAGKIFLRDLVGPIENGVRRIQNSHLRCLVGYFLGIPAHHVRVGPVVVIVFRSVVLDDNHATILDVFKQAIVIGLLIVASRVGANTQEEGVVFAQG